VSIKIVINGCPLEIFEGATVGDAVRKFSTSIYEDVKNCKTDVTDLDNNKYFLSGELTGGEVFKIEKPSVPETKMNKLKNISIIMIVIALALLVLGTFLKGEKEKEIKITIFHVNDIHGSINTMGKISHIVNSERENNPNVFLLNAGDNFSGNPVVDMYDPKGEPLLILMNEIKFDAETIGNHEFDYGKSVLKRFIEKANFPILCSNIKNNDPNFLQPEPFTVLKTKGGVEIVILGLIQTEKHSGIPSTLPDNVKNLVFFNGIEFALKYKYLKKDDNVFIALSHLGYQRDKELAKNMKEFDVIIGGHSHTLVEKPVLENGVLITQAGAHANYLGRIDIIIKNGKIVEKKGIVIDLSSVKKSSQKIDKMVSDFNNSSSLNKILTKIDTTIKGRHNLGLMVTDAIREKLGLDFIFYNAGGIRINKLSGTIRAKDIYKMHPFGNHIVEIRMDTSEIKDLIKNDFEGHGRLDIIPSGLTYRITRDLNKKVQKVELFSLDGYKISDKKIYSVGLNNYIVSSYNFHHKDPGRSHHQKTVDIILDFFTNLKRKLNYSDVVRVEEKIVYSGATGALVKTQADIFTAKKKFYQNSSSGNLITDAMRKYSKADVALYPTRLLQNSLSIKKGTDIYIKAFPDIYGFITRSRIITVSITGEQLEQFILKRSGNKHNIDVQISGGSYKIFYDHKNRVKDIKLTLDNGKSVLKKGKYTVALIEYEYDNFYSLKKTIKSPVHLKKYLDKILAEYLKNLGSVSETISDKRIFLIKD